MKYAEKVENMRKCCRYRLVNCHRAHGSMSTAFWGCHSFILIAVLYLVIYTTCPFLCRWPFGLLPVFGCYIYCCCEYFSRCILVNTYMFSFEYMPRAGIAESYCRHIFSLNCYVKQFFQSKNFPGLFSYSSYI